MSKQLLFPFICLCANCVFTAVAGTVAPQLTSYPHLTAFFQRAQHGERLNVAFLGGSITFGATSTDPYKTSYRALVTRYLEDSYPQAHIRAIDAAIGGIGSELAVFRMDRDVLPYHPDLTFIEFAVNDWGQPDSQEIMEGIIRKLRISNPKMAIVILIIGSNYNYSTPPVSAAHKALAVYYNIPAIDIASVIEEKVKSGLDTHTILTDGCHPNDKGYVIYAEIITEQLKALAKQRVTAFPALPKPLTTNRFESAHMLELSTLPLTAAWRIETPTVTGTWFDHQPSRWLSSVITPTADNVTLPITLKCSGVGLYFELARGGNSIQLFDGTQQVLDCQTSMNFDYGRVAHKFTFLGENRERNLSISIGKKDNVRIGYLLYTQDK